MNDNIASIITEFATAVGGEIVRRDAGSKPTVLINKCNFKASNRPERIDLAELSTLINRRKEADIRKYNKGRFEHALTIGGRLESVNRKLGIGKNTVYAIGDEGNITTNTNKLNYPRSSEEIYAVARKTMPIMNDGAHQEELDIPPVRTDEVNKSLEAMQRDKAAEVDQVTADLLKNFGHIVLEKLGTL